MTQLPQSAYVHVPFCVHRCGYCDFTVIARRDDLIQPYLHALELELSRVLFTPQPLQTLFIGGGTPTYLPAAELDSLLSRLAHWLPLQAGAEYSVEANPAGLDEERLQVLQRYGVNRLSLGVQSLHAQHLTTLERDHSPADVYEVIRQARHCGFKNLSIDLIYGVPGQSVLAWQQTLEGVIALQPEHISTYGLTFEQGTAYWTRRKKGALTPVPEEAEREMYALAMSTLPAAGYAQYELSNFAKPGYTCRHNQVYWRAEPYYGFGPGAASYRSGIRSTNHRSVTTWLKRLVSNASPTGESEELSRELLAREAVMLGLRQIAGIDESLFEDRFGRPLSSLAPEAYERFRNSGLLISQHGRLALSLEGRFLADHVVREFL